MEFGHLEFDTVLGTKDTSDVIRSFDERKTRNRFIIMLPSRSAAAIRKGLEHIIEREPLPRSVFKSITADNGPESSHPLHNFPDIPIFSPPCSAWERGTNEDQNGLLRRFFPKGRSFFSVSGLAILHAQNCFNDLHRKIFDYS